jgi:outer membrane murein-binding lipoprotein Lpp
VRLLTLIVATIILSGCVEQHRYDRLKIENDKAKETIHNQAAGMAALREQRDAMQEELDVNAAARVGREESTVEALKGVAEALNEISASNAKVAEAQLAQAAAQTAQTTFWEGVRDEWVLNWPGAVVTIGSLLGANEYRKRRKNGKASEAESASD